MRSHIRSQALSLLLLVFSVEKCLTDIKANANTTQNLVDPVYSLCTSFCRKGQDFSSWLLPYLALISQLPFGAQYRLDNLMSAMLTVGSPALAGYSLFITLLNSLDYPNSRFAVSIISGLQQSPLNLHSDRARFASLVVLPENDSWWQYFSELVDYTHTWSIASATSIAWVVVAYILSITNTPSDFFVNSQAGDESTIMGWLQLSPKCDFNRLQAAYDPDSPIATPPASAQRALTITSRDEDVMSPDELLTPPVFNYSRSLQWAYTAEIIFQMYKAASEKALNRIPVNPGNEWVESDDFKSIHPCNRRGSPQEITAYCAQADRARCSHWAPGVFTRMVIASCASLALQWGTGIGCRSLSYLLYGVVSTCVWMMLLTSSILAHYSAAYYYRASLSARVALAFSHLLRRMGKLLAIINFIWVISACILQYSGVYDTCFCNASVISRGEAAAYVTIVETAAQLALTKAAWIGALVLACTSASAFIALVSLLLDTLST
ncbi:hypothetical protein BD769DRAFT_1625827 [Suillus cothurnatus]|nr:hypothetical protein BD769DRAFT_1625827 [Suillus cothurnatus]